MTTIADMNKWLDDNWKYSLNIPSQTPGSRPQLRKLSGRAKRSIAFIPGAFLITLGLLVVCFPQFFLVVVSAALIFFGVILSCLAWKLIEAKKKLSALVKDLESKIHVQSFEMKGASFSSPEETQGKKITYH